MQFGSAGAGSATHLGCVVLNSAMGANITHVPYRGTGPAMQDLQGGRIDYLCEIMSTAKPQIDGGTVKAIAMMTKDRSPALPNVPTATEQGLDVQAYTWNAIFLPKNAPAAIVTKLHDTALRGDAHAGRQGAAGEPRRHDRVGRPRDAANISAASSRARSRSGRRRSRRAAPAWSDKLRVIASPGSPSASEG